MSFDPGPAFDALGFTFAPVDKQLEANGMLPEQQPSVHSPTCDMWHHQGGDYDRDCPACMDLAAADEGLQGRRKR